MIKVILEGQTIQMPDEVAQTDEGLIRALTPLYPDVANAEIARKMEGGETVITVVKRPGPKGMDTNRLPGAQAVVTAALLAASDEPNPAVQLCLELRGLDLATASPEELLALRGRIDLATEQGEAAIESVRRTLKALHKAVPVPARHVPVGF
jgi:hypothetical protein